MRKRYGLIAGAALWAAAVPAAHAEVDGEVAFTTNNIGVGIDNLNLEFSDKPGASFDVTASFGHFYLEGTGWRSFETPTDLGDQQLMAYAGFDEIPLGSSGASLSGYVGLERYGPDLDRGDVVAQVQANFGRVHAAFAHYEGDTADEDDFTTNAVGLSLDLLTDADFTASVSVQYLDATDATNYGVEGHYQLSEHSRVDAFVVDEPDTGVHGGLRLAFTF